MLKENKEENHQMQKLTFTNLKKEKGEGEIPL